MSGLVYKYVFLLVVEVEAEGHEDGEDHESDQNLLPGEGGGGGGAQVPGALRLFKDALGVPGSESLTLCVQFRLIVHKTTLIKSSTIFNSCLKFCLKKKFVGKKKVK